MESKPRVLQEDVRQRTTASKWTDIDWPKCEATVRRLQARIVKAEKEGRHNKVKSLQWLLTRSFAARALAVRRVSRNKGRQTPGIDGERWTSPTARFKAVLALKLRGYKPAPLRRVHIPKSNGKKRPLGIPTMKDRAMQALLLMALNPIAEARADLNSYGFRPWRSTHDAVKQLWTILARRTAPHYVLEADIKGCFDNISHQWLMDNIPMRKDILKGWLKAGFMEKGKLFPTKAGSPQGGIVSPTIANMTLDGLEAAISKVRKTHPGQWIHTIRYADDFVVTAKQKETLQQVILPIIEAFLAERGLSLSHEKTKVTHIYDGFDFLGQNFRKFNGKLIVSPSKNNRKSFLRKIRTTIKRNKTTPQWALINILNPKIRGWANYHSGISASREYKRVDSEIWIALWRWATRRHPMKSRRWIKDRYFPRIGRRKWNFSTRMKDDTQLTLYRAATTRIRRHIKIKAELNPYDPKWDEYLDQVTLRKLLKPGRGWKKIRSVLKRQKDICPICQGHISDWKNLTLSRKRPISRGGKDQVTNLILTHRECSKRSTLAGPLL